MVSQPFTIFGCCIIRCDGESDAGARVFYQTLMTIEKASTAALLLGIEQILCCHGSPARRVLA
jgi:hypothetical protein